METSVWNQVNLRDLMEKLEPARPKVNNVAKLKAKLEDDTNPAPESSHVTIKTKMASTKGVQVLRQVKILNDFNTLIIIFVWLQVWKS